MKYAQLQKKIQKNENDKAKLEEMKKFFSPKTNNLVAEIGYESGKDDLAIFIKHTVITLSTLEAMVKYYKQFI